MNNRLTKQNSTIIFSFIGACMYVCKCIVSVYIYEMCMPAFMTHDGDFFVSLCVHAKETSFTSFLQTSIIHQPCY